MTYNFVTIDGHRVEEHVAAAFYKLAAGFHSAFPEYELKVTVGVRTKEEQQSLFNAYIANPKTAALALKPPLSNHEIDGPIGPRALDIHDTGTTPGVTALGNARSAWIRANAHLYGFNPAGFNFSKIEPWHIECTLPLTGPVISVTGLNSVKLIEEDEDMSYSFVKDANSATIYLVSLITGNRVGIRSPYHVNVLKRAKKNNADDPMLMGELDIVHSYLALANPPSQLDIAAVTKTITDTFKSAKLDVGADTIKAAVTQAINSQVEVLTKAINDDAAERLKN